MTPTQMTTTKMTATVMSPTQMHRDQNDLDPKDKMTALSATNRNVIGEALTDVSSDVL